MLSISIVFPFKVLSNISSYGYTPVYYSRADGHLDFQYLGIMNNAAINIHVQFFRVNLIFVYLG